uniref:Uncharacterized protein n=1 Tax=Trichuris muris TaxID=70415 RepID=A0A5S6R2D4_TRIMR
MQDPLAVEELISGLDTIVMKLRKVQDEIESSLPEDKLEQEVNLYMMMERSIRDLRVEARLYLGKKKDQTHVKEAEDGRSSAPVLPKWNLSKFDSYVLLFTAFWDQFDSGVHSRTDISDVTKFVYLRTCLVGTAVDAIAGYSITGANYPAAVVTLKSRFGRPKMIAEKHILELAEMEKCSRPQRQSCATFTTH